VVKNVVFDWSGTLVDDLPAVLAATNHVLRQAGLEEFTLERFRTEFSLPFTGFYERYTPHVPLQKLETWFHSFFRTAQHSIAALPHAREFLELCRDRRARLFVLSAVHTEHLQRQLEAVGFQGYFERVYAGVMDKQAEIGSVLRENQLAPEETMLIGDMQHDIATAKSGGLFSCAVLTGYNRLDQLQRSEPDWIVEHLGELAARLGACGWTPVRQKRQ
jgi:phosphoglycolate phosphatase